MYFVSRYHRRAGKNTRREIDLVNSSTIMMRYKSYSLYVGRIHIHNTCNDFRRCSCWSLWTLGSCIAFWTLRAHGTRCTSRSCIPFWTYWTCWTYVTGITLIPFQTLRSSGTDISLRSGCSSGSSIALRSCRTYSASVTFGTNLLAVAPDHQHLTSKTLRNTFPQYPLFLIILLYGGG